MPTEPRDVVTEAWELALYVQGVADSNGGGKLSRVPELLRLLADECERLRRQVKQMAQDARDDAQAAANEARWSERQGEDYGSY